jgi:Ca2+-binding RTX toxin-like protein
MNMNKKTLLVSMGMGLCATMMASSAFGFSQCRDRTGVLHNVGNTCTLNTATGQAGPGSSCEGRNSDDIIIGSNGPDVINSRGGDDIVVGLFGDDVICTAGGSDVVDAGEGDDDVRSGSDSDAVFLGCGTDYAWLGSSFNRKTCKKQQDCLDVASGGTNSGGRNRQRDMDNIFGQNDKDIIGGGPQNDVVDGGNGDDVLLGEDGDDDQIQGGRGYDICVRGETNATGNVTGCERVI